jgi:hypothetical protein
MNLVKHVLTAALVFFLAGPALAQDAKAQNAAAQSENSVTYIGESGPGLGKHIVFLASDHEYRGEETCPALARILARHYGFKCTVIFGTDPATGFLQPGSSHVSGLDVLGNADLLVVFLRYQDFPADQMKQFIAYVDSGKPIIGLRTATHAFQIRNGDYVSYSHTYTGPEYEKGFGRQVLGETWVSHYGPNHTTSGRMVLEEGQLAHPILTGVKDVWLESGVYRVNPKTEGTTILARSRVLDGMAADAPPHERLTELQPSAWVRNITSKSGASQRVFTTTHGSSKDLLNDGFRRMLVNASLWSVGLENAIKPDSEIAFVGPYQPSNFDFNGAKLNVKPADIAGWDTPILGGDAPPPRGNRRGRGGQRAN